MTNEVDQAIAQAQKWASSPNNGWSVTRRQALALAVEIESLRATVARLEQIETAAREYRRRFRSGERGVTPARERLFRALDGEA